MFNFICLHLHILVYSRLRFLVGIELCNNKKPGIFQRLKLGLKIVKGKDTI